MKLKFSLFLALFSASLGIFSRWQFTKSQFTDTEKILGNSIQVGVWNISSSPSPTPTPSPEPTAEPSPPSTLTPSPSPTPSGLLIVINEVEYDASQSGEDSDYEWFEIYNNSGSSIFLSGWTITDNNASDTLPDVTIPAHGFLVVAAKESSFRNNYPSFTGAIVSMPDGKIGNGLANAGDRLVLKDNKGNEVDAVSWGDDNYAFGPGNGVKPATEVGYSISRNPNGYDTNSANDWVKLINPTPGY